MLAPQPDDHELATEEFLRTFPAVRIDGLWPAGTCDYAYELPGIRDALFHVRVAEGVSRVAINNVLAAFDIVGAGNTPITKGRFRALMYGLGWTPASEELAVAMYDVRQAAEAAGKTPAIDSLPPHLKAELKSILGVE